MRKAYEVTSGTGRRAIAEFIKREGQFLLPMVELVEHTELAIDEVIQVMGRATIEAVLEMSAEGVAGPKQSGKARAEGATVWFGRRPTCRTERSVSSALDSDTAAKARAARSRCRRMRRCADRALWRIGCWRS